MTVLVTGATGLIGTRLLPRLVGQGVDCRALLRKGKAPPIEVAVAEGDLLDLTTLDDALAGVSAIIHLAALFRTPDTDLIWKSNLDGTRNLIAAAKVQAPDARFIMASTSLVYDMHALHPGREDDLSEPKQAYPASKLAAEDALRQSGLTWSILRFAFVYGDGDGHLEALPRLAANAGFHPAQRMSMIHHRDIAIAVKLALDGAMDGHVVNLVDEAPTSLYELCDMLGEAMPPSSEPLANPWYMQADGARARSLGFRPTIRTVHQSIQEGLM